VVGAPAVGPVTLNRAAASATTGLAAALTVGGAYSGNATFQYEVMVSDTAASPSSFVWRKYLKGSAAGGGPWSVPMVLTLHTTYLDEGLSLSWGAVTGQALGDTWDFTAHKGDTFQWRKDDGAWSWEQRISNVGLVEEDIHNAGAEAANTDLQAFGDYEGNEDVSFVLEILAGCRTYRWKTGEYMTMAGAYSGVDGTFSTSKVPLGAWGPETNIVPDMPQYLSHGVYVQFASDSGHTHGDTYYIPCKVTTHHRLSDDVYVSFGAQGGYSTSDVFTFTASAAVMARGPLDGNTELIVAGSGFLPSDQLRCKLYDESTGYEMVVPAQYDSGSRVRCRTAAHPPDTVSAVDHVGIGDPAMDVMGVFSGVLTSEFLVERSATTVTYSVNGFPAVSVPNVAGGGWVALQDGLSVRFQGARYVDGDSWSFTAHFVDFDNLNNHPEVALGTIKPGVMKQVHVSNDGGVTWSKEGTALTRFLFSDVYVSAAGDDAAGEGTWAQPYRTIQRAIQASLAEPRSSFLYASGKTGESYQGASSGGLDRQINRDSIVVLDGRYAGVGNTGLFPMGKMLVISAAHRGGVVIDCDMGTAGDIYNGDRFQATPTTGHATLRGINVENCANRFVPLA